MSLGKKIGKSFVKMAKTGDRIDEGLDRLLGQNRTKAGQGFSSMNAGKRAAATVEKSKEKDKLSLSSGKKNKKDIEFFNEKSKEKEGDDNSRRFY